MNLKEQENSSRNWQSRIENAIPVASRLARLCVFRLFRLWNVRAVLALFVSDKKDGRRDQDYRCRAEPHHYGYSNRFGRT